MRGISSRMILVGICAWISVCLLITGWIPEINDEYSSIWLLSGLAGLVSAVGLAEAIKADINKQKSLLDEYMQAAMTDGLTGLANRQALDRSLSSALKGFDPGRAPRERGYELLRRGVTSDRSAFVQSPVHASEQTATGGLPLGSPVQSRSRLGTNRQCRASLCLIMIDIDHFKAFNDHHGHQAGDAVLSFMSQKMLEFFKGQGTAARYGGEEFAVMVPGVGVRDCFQLAEEFRQLMKHAECEFREKIFRITISAGVTEAQPGDTPESLLRRADLALYSAKKMGRDCIWASESTSAHGDKHPFEQVMPSLA